MRIGEVIASLRKQKGVEQQVLAKKLGKSVTYISLIENNRKKPSFTLLADIAGYFDIPVTTLVFMSVDVSSLKEKKQKAYFKAARPIVDQLINYLLSDEMAPKGKDPLAPRKSKKKTTSKSFA